MRRNGLARFAAISVGSTAAHTLRHARMGKVLAIFNRSFCVTTNAGLICVGLPSIGRGPLNVLIDDVSLGRPVDVLPCQVSPSATLDVDHRRIVFPGSWEIDVSAAPVYVGRFDHQLIDPLVVTGNRSRLSNLPGAPAEGFAWLLADCIDKDCSGESAIGKCCTEGGCVGEGCTDGGCVGEGCTVNDELRRVSRSALATLWAWLHSVFKECASASPGRDVIQLIGAGPGLTPAGDDLLAGAMLALHRLGRVDLATVLWQSLESATAARTHRLSAAHLSQAAEGQCSEVLQSVINDVMFCASLRREAVQRRLRVLGASTGWDTLAGVALVLDAWLESLRSQRTPDAHYLSQQATPSLSGSRHA